MKYRNELAVWTDGTDTYVAANRVDLQNMFKEQTGSTMQEMTGDDDELDNWRMVYASKIIKIMGDEDDTYPPESSIEEIPRCKRCLPEWTQLACASAADWAAFSGRGLLCSTEY